jgi:hypothetical protein
VTSAAAYLLISITFNGAHRSVDGIRYDSMKDCTAALAVMIQKMKPAQKSLTREPYCTDKKPDWWID